MKHAVRITIGALLAIALPAGSLGAQESPENAPLWLIAEHRIGERLEREISSTIEEGYVPVGMEFTEEHLSMLYVRTDDFDFQRWTIHEFTNLDNLEEEFSGFLLEAWVPVAISRTDEGLTTLFLEDESIELSAWQLTVGEFETQAILDTYDQWRQRGYESYGISMDDEERIWYLFLDIDTPAPPALMLFNGYPKDEAAEGINADIEQGGVPWGLIDSGENYYLHFLMQEPIRSESR